MTHKLYRKEHALGYTALHNKVYPQKIIKTMLKHPITTILQ